MPRARRTILLAAAILLLVAAGGRLALDQQTRTAQQRQEAAATLAAATNYDEVEPGLYVGAFVPAPPPGTEAVLNLSFKQDPYRTDVYRWQPIPDADPAPSLEWLESQVDYVDAQRKAGKTLYVHCDAGISRSVMVVAAYLMREHHLPRDAALELIRARRPLAQPNTAFMHLLQDWQHQPEHVSVPAHL